MYHHTTVQEAVALAVPRDRNPALHYLASLAPGSRPAMHSALKVAAAFFGSDDPLRFDWSVLRYQHTNALRSFLAQKYAPKTCNRHLCAVRGVLRQCWKLDQLSSDEYHRTVSVGSVRGTKEREGRSLTEGERRTLFRGCDLETPLGARDAAMLALLYGCGLRRAEVVAIDLGDVEDNIVRVRRGKGGKFRRAYLPAGGVRALAAWLRFRGDEPGPLLYASRGGRRGIYGLIARRLHPDTVRATVAAMAERSGVHAFTPHDVRRSWIGDLLDAGLDIRSIQELAGHSNVGTTGDYDRRPERARARSAELLTIPL